MATITYGPNAVSVNFLPPGGEEHWQLMGFALSSTVQISAHPFSLKDGKDRKCMVTNIEYEAAPDGSRRVFFTVKNTGIEFLNYKVVTSWIGP
jgi:hypothetical protein